MDTAIRTAGLLSAKMPWVAEEYFSSRSRSRQNFPSSATTSWCSTIKNSNPGRRVPVVKDNTAEDRRRRTNEEVLMARLGVNEVGHDSRKPFILVQSASAALERVPRKCSRSSASSHRQQNQIQSKNFLDVCDRCRRSSDSVNFIEEDASEGRLLAMTLTETKNEDDFFDHHQSFNESDFDRLEPCYDWYLSCRDQELNTILETRSAQGEMGLQGRSSLRTPPGINTGSVRRRPRTAPAMKMTRIDRPTTTGGEEDEWLVIRKLNILHRQTDSLTPSRFQRKVVDDRDLLGSMSGRDEKGRGGVRSDAVPSSSSSEETLSCASRNGMKGTVSSELDSTSAELFSTERPQSRAGSRDSQHMTSFPRDKIRPKHGVDNVDDQDLQKDSAILLMALGVTEGSLEEQSNAFGSVWHKGEKDELDDSVSDKEQSISSGYRLPTAADDERNPMIGVSPTGGNSIAPLEKGGREQSPENSDEANIKVREMHVQTQRPAPVASTVSTQRPKTAGRRISSGVTRHRCSRKAASDGDGKQKMTDNCCRPKPTGQQKMITKERTTQRRESRRKRIHRHRTFVSDDVESLTGGAAVATCSSPITESLIEQFPFCQETTSEENPSAADFKLNNCVDNVRSGATPSRSELLSARRRSLYDAAIQRNLSFVKSSRSERELFGGTEGGEGLANRRPLQAMDLHKIDMEVGERDGRRKDYHKSKQNGRIAFSQRSCRFELPMDMKQFEKLSPQEYLRKYCRISQRRQILYKRIFLKYVANMIGWFPRKDLLKLLTELLGEAACDNDVTYICDLLQITDDTRIDLELFSVTAAVTERLLYPQFVTQHTRHIQDYKKEEIEKADFSALLTKLNGIHVRPEMKNLVDAIK